MPYAIFPLRVSSASLAGVVPDFLLEKRPDVWRVLLYFAFLPLFPLFRTGLLPFALSATAGSDSLPQLLCKVTYIVYCVDVALRSGHGRGFSCDGSLYSVALMLIS